MLRRISKYVCAGVLVALALVRLVGLEDDPPLFYIGHGQSQLTDPYQMTFFARNAVLYGDWNPYGYHRWDVFKNSLVSATSNQIFSVSSVSRGAANLTGVLLQVGGLLLFLFGFRKLRDHWQIGLMALILFLNSSLFFYGRLPFLENGLIFLSGLTFFVFVRYHHHIWGQALSGALIAFAALGGKLFGFVLLGPVILSLLYRYRSRVAAPALVTIGGSVAGAALYVLVFYGGSVSTLMSYYSEQAVGMYGSPPGFTSVVNFFKMFVTYGGESGFCEYVPFLVLLGAAALVMLLLSFSFTGEFRSELIPLVFCVGWLIGGVFGLMPFYYRPLRYGLFLLLPISAIGAYAVRQTVKERLKLRLTNKWISLPFIFLVCWYVGTQIHIFFQPVGQKFRSGAEVMFTTAVIALVITGVLFLWLYRGRRIVRRPLLLIPFGLLFLGFTVYQGMYLFQGLTRPGAYLKQYNAELVQLVDKDAVLTGPYMPALTIDNELEGVIYMFGLADVEKGFFERYPITHIVTDRSNWTQAVKDYPFLQSAVRIVQMVVREQVIDLYRLPGADIPLTDFERGAVFLAEGQHDSMLISFQRFSEENPENLLAKTHVALALCTNDKAQEAVALLDRLVAQNPANYMVHGFCKGLYRRLYDATRERDYFERARYHDSVAMVLNPVVAKSK